MSKKAFWMNVWFAATVLSCLGVVIAGAFFLGMCAGGANCS